MFQFNERNSYCIYKMACCLCTVLEVKPFSGYYTACPRCVRKLVLNTHQDVMQRYWCRECLTEWSVKEVTHRYCVALVVTDNHKCIDIVVFGKSLEGVFGVPASDLHHFLLQNWDCGYHRKELIIKALEMIFLGHCYSFNFQVSKHFHTVAGAPAQLSQLMDLSSPLSRARNTRLTATGLQPLGTSLLTVIAILKRQLSSYSQESNFHNQVNTVSKCSEAAVTQSSDPCRGDYATPSQSYVSVEPLSAEGSQTSQAIQFESYYQSQSNSCSISLSDVKEKSTEHVQMHELLSQSAIAKHRFSPLSLSDKFDKFAKGEPDIASQCYNTSDWHLLNTTAQSQRITDSPSISESTDDAEVAFKESFDVKLSDEIIQELESEWESTQQTYSHLSTSSSNPHLSFCSISSNLAMSEEVVEELQESFSHSRGTTPATNSVAGEQCSRQALQSAHSELMCKHNPTMCGITPELFSSAGSTHSCNLTCSSELKFQSFPKLNFSANSSTPELFETQPQESKQQTIADNNSTTTSKLHFTQSQGLQSDGRTPALHRVKLKAPRRKLLQNVGTEFDANAMRYPLQTPEGIRSDSPSFSPDLL